MNEITRSEGPWLIHRSTCHGTTECTYGIEFILHLQHIHLHNGCKCCCQRYPWLFFRIVHHTFDWKMVPNPHSNNKTCLEMNSPPLSAWSCESSRFLVLGPPSLGSFNNRSLNKSKQSTLLVFLANSVNFFGVSMTTFRYNIILGTHLFEKISGNWIQISNEIEQHIRRWQCKYLRLFDSIYQWNVWRLHRNETWTMLDTYLSPPWLP